jgi:putative endonuclease
MNYIYILTNKYNKVFYIGVTSNLIKRIFEHKSKSEPKSFTAKYNLNKLVYYESTEDIISAIEREKYLKHKTKSFKIQLVQSINPDFQDLYPTIVS